MVTLAWSMPDYEGDYGPIHGYQIQCRRAEDSDWRIVCPHLITEPRYTGKAIKIFISSDYSYCSLVYALEPNGRYEFRALGKNAAGFGEPSSPSPMVQLRSKYSHIQKQRQAFEPGMVHLLFFMLALYNGGPQAAVIRPVNSIHRRLLLAGSVQYRRTN